MDELSKYHRYKAFYQYRNEIVDLYEFIKNQCEETLDNHEGYEDTLERIAEKIDEMLGQI